MIDINDLAGHSASLLLRYFREGRSNNEIQSVSVNYHNDLEFLKICWALSSNVKSLVKYIHENRFEISGNTEYQSETSDISVKGQIESNKTILLRLRTGNPNSVCYKTSRRVFHNGMNTVLIWTLLTAEQYCRKLINFFPENHISTEGLLADAHDILFLLNNAKRIPFIKQAVESFKLANRPTSTSLLQCKQSRKLLYRHAFNAYETLQYIEHANENIIKATVIEKLILPKEDYQILELALAFSLGEALAKRLNKKVSLKEISLNGTSIVLSVGDITIDWQTRTDSYTQPALEPSEQKLANILPLYNLQLSTDRPDIIIRHAPSKKVIAIGEAKFFKDISGWRDPLRDALYQIVRYSRGYSTGANQDGLIARSCIGLMHYPTNDRSTEPPPTGPIILDAKDIVENKILNWIERIIPYYESIVFD